MTWILFLTATKAETKDILDFCFFIIGDAYLDFGWSVPKSEFRSPEKNLNKSGKMLFLFKNVLFGFRKIRLDLTLLFS